MPHNERMRVALISSQPWGTYSHYPPIHLLYLAKPLLRQGFDVRVFDCGGYSKAFWPTALESWLQEFRPQLIGTTLYSPMLPRAYDLLQRVRRLLPDVPIVAGGGHATAAPEHTLQVLPMVDYALVGEADQTFRLLVEALAGNSSLDEIPGLARRCGNEIVLNPGYGMVSDPAEIPIPPRHLLDEYYRQEKYWHILAGGPVDMMISTRGCSFDCSFCFKVCRQTRFTPADQVMAEIESIVARGIQHIHIMDDAFTLKRDRAVTVLSQIRERYPKVRLKIRSRVTSVDRDFLRLAGQCGVDTIVYGIESGSQRILDNINKGVTVEQNEEAIRLTKEAGITCVADVMMGMPAETPETIEETVQFLQRTAPVVGPIPMLYPLPTTEVFETAKADGTLEGEWDPLHPENRPWIRLPWTPTRHVLAEAIHKATVRIHRSLKVRLYFLSRTLLRLRLRHCRYIFRVLRREP